ncbi:aquaporin AQPAe.a [Drosophila grimshawi]|uniref:GH21220 n=1 Tax=Drosophila grimshawi TaxID=7222 RepID=B4J7D0_DROGR|nr:aquaporin AQPAe.a [Drosophila grimshawi]EDW01054.1 GH21220 [Drosophila grimshawi]
MSQQTSWVDSDSSWRYLKMRSEHRAHVAAFFGELAGTATFIFVACMGCVTSPVFYNTHFELSLNFGLGIMIAIQSFGSISGAHLNPAVTLAAWIFGALSWPMAIAYLVAQVAGGLIGYGLLKAVLPLNAIVSVDNPAGVCVTVLNSDISVLQGVFIEFLITSCLVMVACSIWDPRNARLKDSVPLRFGLTVSSLNLAAGLFTGSSMNPTRSLGPAVWNDSWQDHWIYWVGPLAGAAVTAIIYRLFFKGRPAEVVELQTSNAKIQFVE